MNKDQFIKNDSRNKNANYYNFIDNFVRNVNKEKYFNDTEIKLNRKRCVNHKIDHLNSSSIIYYYSSDLRSPACKKSKQISLLQQSSSHNLSVGNSFTLNDSFEQNFSICNSFEQKSSIHNSFVHNSLVFNSKPINSLSKKENSSKKKNNLDFNYDYVPFDDVLANSTALKSSEEGKLTRNTPATNKSSIKLSASKDKNVTKLHILSETCTNETYSSSNRIKHFLTSSQEVNDVEYWTLKYERLSKELDQVLDELEEFENENELLNAELIEFLRLSKKSSKLKKLIEIL